jgi:hypothetical protein
MNTCDHCCTSHMEKKYACSYTVKKYVVVTVFPKLYYIYRITTYHRRNTKATYTLGWRETNI